MISMHCPSCGAEGRVPNEKVEVKLVCKRCLEPFHLTRQGQIVSGIPLEAPHPHHVTPGHEMDHVDEEIDLVVRKLRDTLRKAGIAAAVLIALFAGWRLIRGGKPLDLQAQATKIASALVHDDVAALRALSVRESADVADELSEALRAEFRRCADLLASASPNVELSRAPQAPGPGLSEFVAVIRKDPTVQRTSQSLMDASIGLNTNQSVSVPLVLAGDDDYGWQLDAGRTLEAYRKARTVEVAPRESREGTGRRRGPDDGGPGAVRAARPTGSPRA